MHLFDDIERNSIEPADYSQQDFDYINQTARPEYVVLRKKVEEWFGAYQKLNPKEAGDLRARFRLEDEQHFPALSELYIHQLLVENGYTPIAHPSIPGTTSRPEFIINGKNGEQYMVEVVTILDNLIKRRTSKLQNTILDRVDKVNSPDFLIHVSILDRSDMVQPKLRKMQEDIQRHIDKLNYDQVCKDIESGNDMPEWIWTDGPWRLKFSASPVNELGRKERTQDSRNIGAIMPPAGIINLDLAIKESVSRKALKYGDPGIPYIVAVNVIRENIFCDEEEIISALFGKLTVTYTILPDGTNKSTPGRTFDGIWVYPGRGIQNTRMSGLLVIPGITISKIGRVEPILWHHIAPKHPIDPNFLNIKQKKYNDNTKMFEDLDTTPQSSSPNHIDKPLIS